MGKIGYLQPSLLRLLARGMLALQAGIIHELVGQASSLSVGQDRQDDYPTLHVRE